MAIQSAVEVANGPLAGGDYKVTLPEGFSFRVKIVAINTRGVKGPPTLGGPFTTPAKQPRRLL